MSNNPNATVAAFAGAVSVLVVWIVSLFNVDVPPEAASAFTTIIAAGILFAGNRRAQTGTAPAQGARRRRVG